MNDWAPIAELAGDVASGKIKASDLVKKSLDQIKEKAEFQAIIATTEDRALARAKEIDETISKGGKIGRLAGVPFIAKDNFLVFGAETTAASNILKGFNAPYQATAIERLEAEGAICVAKANLDAFAHGGSTENSDFFTTKNPVDKTRVPGGSSGGSAAAVVLGLAPFALGTDTGGSIRLPASFTGCFGYKPTYGLVSRSGVVAMASSTDTIGPLARTAEDAALVLDVIAGRDKLDGTTIESNKEGYVLTDKIDLANIRVGVVKEYMNDAMDSGVKKQIENAIKKLEAAGAKISEISIPSTDLALAAYYIIVPAEISSNLSRYDGQRYGFSYKEAKNLEESYLKSREIGFGKEAKRRIIIGTFVLSAGYQDAYYKQAQLVRTKLVNEFNEAYKQVDFLLGPTAPFTAFKIGEKVDDPLQMYLADILTVSANLVGAPAVSIPCGLSDGLPVGMQLMAPQRHDRELLKLSQACEEILR